MFSVDNEGHEVCVATSLIPLVAWGFNTDYYSNLLTNYTWILTKHNPDLITAR